MTTEEKLKDAIELLERFMEMHREYDMRPEDELYDYANDVNDFLNEIKQ